MESFWYRDTSKTSYWSQQECSFRSTNTTSHSQEFTVRYTPRTTSQGIITNQFFVTSLTCLVLPSLTWL